ncbi:MAG: YggS family pyridoxal phosphate enzyme [Alphaproteobacteria bacterium RIFCSPHIGHO2_12_FULL_63_12]|nr:MAG: YggS family pyridoxal phosphate enzyme [Alphaproteobacteria bacterium RIFCSPHIGHO2_12_FULL_63_12]
MHADADHLPPADFAASLARIRARLDAALKEAGRRGPVEIVAVSKTQGEARLKEALAAGQRVFGENRVQEAKAKWPALRAEFPDVELRLIGPLQSNKAAEAIALFDVIETIDRPKIARALKDEAQKQARRPRFLIQVNTGAEAQKAGVLPEDADAFIRLCRDELGMEVEGLMCIPPAEEPPAPHFALLARIAARNRLGVLSMGMSGDFEIAAQLGATHIRVGTALFGDRMVKPDTLTVP